MDKDPVRGKTIRWSYDDGPVKGQIFEHTFGSDGKVAYREAGGSTAAASANEPSIPYNVEVINDHVYAISYLSTNKWTLTTIVDETSKKIVSFASNEKSLVVQHGKLLT